MVPKFRAWDKNTNDMVDIKTIDLERDGSVGCVVDYSSINLDVSECVLMQSTGLKDRKGVEIFEGDIVWIIDEGELDNGWGWSEEVIFHNGSFMAGDDNLLANVNHRCVVSGNKYEREELLEPANEN